MILRHTELTAYRCFLPDLAGFTGFCCTGPSPFSQVQSKKGKVVRTYDRSFCLLTSYFYLALVWRRGWAFEVARAETALAPTEGASPLVCSPRGGYIPHDPPVRIPPSLFFISPSFPDSSLNIRRSACLFVAERVGFEPTVPLLGRMLSKHVDSTTLAPLHADFRKAAS